MPVFRWGQSWDPILDLEREVDRLLQGMNLTSQGRSSRRFPLINLLDGGDCFLLTAELPGVQLEDLELTATNGVLTLKGVRKAPAEAQTESFRRQERFQGNWKRSVHLPDRVDEDGMKAEYSAGVLRVILPKVAGSVARSIPVTEGSD
jgi:HSP20 family protein